MPPHALPTLDAAKAQAKALRQTLATEGREITHSAALELIAKSHGLKDWNTLHAAIGNAPPPPATLGQIVEGRYLNQPSPPRSSASPSFPKAASR